MLLKVWAWMLLEASDKPPPRFTTDTASACAPAAAAPVATPHRAQAMPTGSSQTMVPAPVHADAVTETCGRSCAGPMVEAGVGARDVESVSGVNGGVSGPSAACARSPQGPATVGAGVPTSASPTTCGAAPPQAHCFQEQVPTPTAAGGIGLTQCISQASVATRAVHLKAPTDPNLGEVAASPPVAALEPTSQVKVHDMHACTHDAEQQWRRTRRTQRCAPPHTRGHMTDAAVAVDGMAARQQGPARVTRHMHAAREHPGRHARDVHQGSAEVNAGTCARMCVPQDGMAARLRCSGEEGEHHLQGTVHAAAPKRTTRASSTKVSVQDTEPVAGPSGAHASGVRRSMHVRRRCGTASESHADCAAQGMHSTEDAGIRVTATIAARSGGRASSARNAAYARDQAEEMETDDHAAVGGSAFESPGAASLGRDFNGTYVHVVPPQSCGGVRGTGGKGWLQGWRLRAAGGVPQQRDGGSCGVFSLAFADCVMRGWWPCTDPVPGANGASEKASRVKKGSQGSSRVSCRTGSDRGSQAEMLVPSRKGSADGCQTPGVCLEFGDVASLRLGLLQELTCTAQYETL